MEEISRTLIRVLFALSPLSLGSCTNCDTVDPMPTEPVRFVIVDQDGKNLVTGNNSTYHPDSIKLLAGTETVLLTKQLDASLKGYIFEAYPPNNASGSTKLQLYLNRFESETLVTYYEHHKSDCSDYYSYSRFTYNGWEVQKDNATGIIEIDKAR